MSLLIASLAATASASGTWTRDDTDGVLTASVALGEMDYVELLCDTGINIPITSLSFMIHGNVPDAESQVEFRFGNQADRIFATTDAEGVIASISEEDGAVFEELIEKMRAESKMLIRLPSGIRQTFPLSGSGDALAGCSADMYRDLID